jgi:outer membrane protein OmpA-like peptidoglycan-associated protein
MKRSLVVVILCSATAVSFSACATKKFVREQVGMTETALGSRVDTQQNELRQTAERTNSNAQAIQAATQRLQTVDARVNEVSALARDAREEAGAVGQKFANRNKYAQLEKKSVYFDFNKAALRDEGMTELEDVARALKADPNAVVELQGFADPRGNDEYNYRLTRERVDSVIRYLVQRHGIELRRVSAVGMGKAPAEQGARRDRDALAKSRRVAELIATGPRS